jgi:hypothetical protein
MRQVKPLPGPRKTDRGQATKRNLVETGEITVYLAHWCGMKSSKRAGEKNSDTEAGNQAGIADQKTDERKEKIKCFLD